ncbi:putative integral membrane protein [Bradyrhizobium sp. LB7.2]
MRKFLTALIVIPLGLILMVFAVANRQFVTVSFDPFVSNDPSFSVTLPLFLLLIVVAALGVFAGGCAVWFGQRHWRRAARRNEAEARAARGELADLRGPGGRSKARVPAPPRSLRGGPLRAGRARQAAREVVEAAATENPVFRPPTRGLHLL